MSAKTSCLSNSIWKVSWNWSLIRRGRWLNAFVRAEREFRLFIQRPASVRSWPRGSQWRNSRESVRSEEHTSELQSLMRISYAVFCLKKKKDMKAQGAEIVR